jgi:hypothetical protein
MISCQIAEQGIISGKSKRIRVESGRVGDPVYRQPFHRWMQPTPQDRTSTAWLWSSSGF